MKAEEFVLIVEDDNEWRDIIKSLIKKNFSLGCKTTKNYQDSIKLLRFSAPLAVILDLNLNNDTFDESQWAGWHLAELVREKHIPLIIVTGYPRDDRIARAFKNFKVKDFFDKKNFANRTPDFIEDIEEIIRKLTKQKINTIIERKTIQRKVVIHRDAKFKKNGMTKNNSLFISYSHKNRNWLNRFTPHLQILVDNNLLKVWDDTKIKVGSKWLDEIQEALLTAKAALLLVTPEFLASDFIKNVELPELINAAEKRGVKIIWVAVKHSMYEDTYLSKFQAGNDPSKPLASLTNKKADQEIVQICKKIKEIIR